MGRGTIVSGGTDGLYTVSLDYGTERLNQLIATFTAAIAELDSAITQAEDAAEDAESAHAVAVSSLDSRIITYNSSQKTDDDKAALQKVTDDAAEKGEAKVEARISVSKLKYQKLSLEARLAVLRKVDTTDSGAMWCTDFTEDASGEVGIIEINGEGPSKVIAPGGRGWQASDGEFTARGVQSPEQAYLNAAILPGWQKFKPTYRSGIISAINYTADTCTVTLDAATSSAQTLPINQAGILTGVPIEYMQCNSTAFDDGDHVVVMFESQDWSQPKVIGFVSNPKPCGPAEIAFLVDYNGFTRNVTGTFDKRLGEQGATTTTNPQDGLEINSTEYEATWGVNPVHSTDKELQYRRRIRFDVAFVRLKLAQEYFDEEMESFEEDTAGASYDMDCIADSSTLVDEAGDNIRITTYNLSPTTIKDDFNNDREVYVGTIDQEDYIFSSVNVSEPLDYIVADYDEATAYMANYYTAPNEVTILIDDKPVTYTLQSFGPPPQLGVIENYEYNSEPDGSGGAVTDKIYSMECVIYRRKVGVS